MINEILNIPWDYLRNTPIIEELNHLIQAYEKAQYTMYNLFTDDNQSLLKLRMGTVLTLAFVNKIANGKNPKEFTNDDWLDITRQVVDMGINVDDSFYSTIVFTTYSDYISVSVAKFERFFSPEECEKIRAISDEISYKTELFSNGELSEVTYTEDCLWLCLEAMIKLLAAYAGQFLGEDFKKFITGATSFAFEYARFTLYSREQQLLEEIIEHQNVLDAELEEKYNQYLQELNTKAEMFSNLIESAFDTDFRARLKGSVELAQNVGVKEEEILDSVDKIDDFFM